MNNHEILNSQINYNNILYYYEYYGKKTYLFQEYYDYEDDLISNKILLFNI